MADKTLIARTRANVAKMHENDLMGLSGDKGEYGIVNGHEFTSAVILMLSDLADALEAAEEEIEHQIKSDYVRFCNEFGITPLNHSKELQELAGIQLWWGTCALLVQSSSELELAITTQRQNLEQMLVNSNTRIAGLENEVSHLTESNNSMAQTIKQQNETINTLEAEVGRLRYWLDCAVKTMVDHGYGDSCSFCESTWDQDNQEILHDKSCPIEQICAVLSGRAPEVKDE